MRRERIPPLVLCVFLALLGGTASFSARAASLETLGGERFQGEVALWTSTRIGTRGAEGERTFSADDLLSVRLVEEPALPDEWTQAAVRLTLRDGSYLPASSVEVVDRQVRVATPLAEEQVSASTRDVELLAFGPLNAPASAAWENIQRDPLPGDVLLIKKKGGESIDYLAGKVESVDDKEVVFDWDGERVPVKRDKVAAIAFYRGGEDELPTPLCKLQLAGGFRLVAKAIMLSRGRLTIETALGLKFSVPLTAVAGADYSPGKLAYLSDLKLLDARWTPLVELPPAAKLIANFGAPRFDRAFDGGPLRVAGGDPAAASAGSATKGLALRSKTQIAYDVPAGMTRFAATAGIDPSCASQGRVELSLHGDQATLWQGVIAGDRPQTLNVDLAGARRLRIVVDYGENLDYGDQLNLLDARFIK